MPVERVSRSFKDISLSFKVHPITKDVIPLKNESAISRAVKNLVLTQLQERPFNPTLGSRIHGSLFELMDAGSAAVISDEIRTTIDNFEPRVELINVEVQPFEYPPTVWVNETAYTTYSIENLDGFTKDVGLVKQLTFDFISRYVNINEKYYTTEKHPAFVWKDKLQTFEWWQAQAVEIGDKMVTSNFELEEVTTIEKMHGDFEIVTLGLRNIHTYFANGYLCRQ